MAFPSLFSLLPRLPKLPQLPPSVRSTTKTILFLSLNIPPLVFLNDNLFTLMWVRGPSMAPLLSPDYHEKGRKDVVLASMWDAGRKARRGEVVAFRAPHDPERVAIKRIVGVEGDIVDTSGGSGDAYPEREVRVPPGHVWVEGVDGGRSLDSRNYGPISKSLITGRVTHVVWPPARASRIETDESEVGKRVFPGGGMRRIVII